jgi:hypothetical protein
LLIPPRNLQLLVGSLSLMRRVIPETDLPLLSPLTSHLSFLTCHFPPDCLNPENSDHPSDEQMQFNSKGLKTFGFSVSGSISCFSLSLFLSLFIFREILSALEGEIININITINITNTHFTELLRLCKKFVFTELAAKLSKIRPSMHFK